MKKKMPRFSPETGSPSGKRKRIRAGLLLLCFLAASLASASGDRIGHDVQNTSASVTGPVSVSSRDEDAIGVQVIGNRGGDMSVTVSGDVSVQNVTDHYDHQNAAGVYVDMSAGSKAAVTLNGNITSVNTWEGGDPGNLDTLALETDVSDGGEADVTVNGSLLARSVEEGNSGYTWSAGLHSGNYGGCLSVTVNGDVTAEGPFYSVGLNAKIETDGEASSFVAVQGNVTAKDIGIRVENTAPRGSMELLVDGILSAERCISLEGDTFEKSRFTVWKAEPLNGGSPVPAGVDVSEANAQRVEKDIRYIIRTDEKSAQYIQVEAEDYHGYSVARAGETVPVRVQAPKGYEVAEVYGMPGNTMLLPGKDGRYELTVPACGGVELSVSLRKKVPSTGDGSAPALWLGMVLLGLSGARVLRGARGNHPGSGK